MKIYSHRNLEVWKKAIDLTVEIYTLVKKLPREELYALSDQMRRAAVSIPSNIAEGQGRKSNKETVNFLSTARGSLHELDSQLEICKRVGYITEDEFNQTQLIMTSVLKMLNSLISYRSSCAPEAPSRTQNPEPRT